MAVALLVTACGSDGEEAGGGSEKNDRVRFLLGFLVQGVHAPWVIGMEKGFFEEEGIDLELVPGESPAVALAGLTAGEGEFASIDLTGLALAKKDDPSLDVKLVASTYASSPYAIFSLRDGGNFEEPSDLEGETIFGTAGTVHGLIADKWLEEHGVSDVKVEEVDPASREQLLIAGEIPAITAFISNRASMEAAATESGEKLITLPMNDKGLSQHQASGIAAKESWVEDNEDLTRRFLAAYVRSFLYAFENPEETADAMTAAYPEIPRDATVNQLAILEDLFTVNGTAENPGRIDPATVEHTISYVGRSLGLDEIDPSSLYLEGYAP